MLPPSLPVVNRRGIVLEAVEAVPEEAAAGPLAHPLTHALVVVRHEGRWLLVWNRRKEHWELPGGVIEPGERPRACAVRELLEETGQAVPLEALGWRGLARVAFPSGRRELGALFAADLPRLGPLVVNDEASRFALWDGREDIGYVCEIDAALLAHGPPPPAP